MKRRSEKKERKLSIFPFIHDLPQESSVIELKKEGDKLFVSRLNLPSQVDPIREKFISINRNLSPMLRSTMFPSHPHPTPTSSENKEDPQIKLNTCRCGFDYGSSLLPFVVSSDQTTRSLSVKSREDVVHEIIKSSLMQKKSQRMNNQQKEEKDQNEEKGDQRIDEKVKEDEKKREKEDLLESITFDIPDIFSPERYRALYDEKEIILWNIPNAIVDQKLIKTDDNTWITESTLYAFPPKSDGAQTKLAHKLFRVEVPFFPLIHLNKALVLHNQASNYYHFIVAELSSLAVALEIGMFDPFLSQAESSHPILKGFDYDSTILINNNNNKNDDDDDDDRNHDDDDGEKRRKIERPSTHSMPYSVDSNPIYLLHNDHNSHYIKEAIDLMGIPKHLIFEFSDTRNPPLYAVDNLFSIQWQRSIRHQKPVLNDQQVIESLSNSTLMMKRCVATKPTSKEIMIALQDGYCDSCLPILTYPLRNMDVPPFRSIQLLRKRMLRNLQIINHANLQAEMADETLDDFVIPIGVANDFDVHRFTTLSVTNKPRNLLIYSVRTEGRRSLSNDEPLRKAIQCVLNDQPNLSHLFDDPISLFIHKGSEPLKDQIETFNRAIGIFGPFGAGLSNTIWSLPGTSIIEFPRKNSPDDTILSLSVAMDQFFWRVSSLNATHDSTYKLHKENVADAIHTIFTALFHSIRHLELSQDPSFDQRILKDPVLFVQFMQSRPLDMQLWPFHSLHSCIQEAQRSLPLPPSPSLDS